MPRNDPVIKLRKPWWQKPVAWGALMTIAVAVAALALGLVVQSNVGDEARKRAQQLQDVICGVYVPIANSPVPRTATELGRTIVAATRHGAVRIHCPGLK